MISAEAEYHLELVLYKWCEVVVLSVVMDGVEVVVEVVEEAGRVTVVEVVVIAVEVVVLTQSRREVSLV